MSRLLIGLIKLYQYTLSPFIGQHCRFNPTCSQYAIEVINKYGGLEGFYLALKRLARCHPWHTGGHDPIP